MRDLNPHDSYVNCCYGQSMIHAPNRKCEIWIMNIVFYYMNMIVTWKKCDESGAKYSFDFNCSNIMTQDSFFLYHRSKYWAVAGLPCKRNECVNILRMPGVLSNCTLLISVYYAKNYSSANINLRQAERNPRRMKAPDKIDMNYKLF